MVSRAQKIGFWDWERFMDKDSSSFGFRSVTMVNKVYIGAYIMFIVTSCVKFGKKTG